MGPAFFLPVMFSAGGAIASVQYRAVDIERAGPHD
jgi:hypothetical protein